MSKIINKFFRPNIENLSEFQYYLSKILTILTIATLLFSIIIFLILYVSIKSKEIIALNQLVYNTNQIFQSDLSEQINIIANNQDFINYLHSGEMTRKENYVDMLWLFSDLDRDLIKAVEIRDNLGRNLFTYGSLIKASNQMTVTIKLCYLNDKVNAQLGDCKYNITIFFNTLNYIKKLHIINKKINICSSSRCMAFNPFLENTLGQFPILYYYNDFLKLDFYIEPPYYLFGLLTIFILLTLILLFVSNGIIKSLVFKYLSKPIKDIEGAIKYDKNIEYKAGHYLVELSYLLDSIHDYKIQGLQATLGKLAAEVAHDLGSPLLSINAAIDNIENNKNGIYNLSALKTSLIQVKNITNNLLSQYRMLTTSNAYSAKSSINNDIEEPRYINVVKLVNDIVVSKNIEWQHNPCNIRVETVIKNPLYLFSPMQLFRVLSNLLNNAYESLTNSNKNIIIYISEDNQYFILSIKDTGIGIAEEKIKNILNGVSFKHAGKGIGISSALEYVSSLSGNLSINSKVNIGTEIVLRFPTTPLPEWLATKVSYTSKSKFVLLDDNPSIHMNLQLRLQSLGIKSFHFVDLDSYSNFISNLDSHQNLIYLVDLNLNLPNLDGFEIIKKFNLLNNQNVYLMTSDAEKPEVQNKVQQYNIKLIDKNIFDSIKFSLIENP